jgi:hypothetical protein
VGGVFLNLRHLTCERCSGFPQAHGDWGAEWYFLEKAMNGFGGKFQLAMGFRANLAQ